MSPIRRSGRRPATLKRVSAKRRRSQPALRAFHAHVMSRSGGRCEACRLVRATDAHHVVKRSQGGSDSPVTNGVALCSACHVATDAPYRTGRLVITNTAPDAFRFDIVYARDKWAARAQGA